MQVFPEQGDLPCSYRKRGAKGGGSETFPELPLAFAKALEKGPLDINSLICDAGTPALHRMSCQLKRPDFVAAAAAGINSDLIPAATLPTRTYTLIKELLNKEKWPKSNRAEVRGNGTCLGFSIENGTALYP